MQPLQGVTIRGALSRRAQEGAPSQALACMGRPKTRFCCQLLVRDSLKKGEAFLLTARAFLLTVELLCLQSVEVLLRHTFPL